MTAKEILEEQANGGFELLEDENVNVYEVLIAMRVYAKAKCEEQRKICGKQCYNTSGVFMKRHTEQVMINSPEPEFD